MVALEGCFTRGSHVSNGGALLEFLELGCLPGTEIFSPEKSKFPRKSTPKFMVRKNLRLFLFRYKVMDLVISAFQMRSP